MITERPSFIDSPYFVAEPGNWHLKEGAPEQVKKEFSEFMNEDRGDGFVDPPDENRE